MPVSSKNLANSLAVQSLGLGDQLKQQVEDELKKRKQAQLAGYGVAAPTLLGTAAGATERYV